MVKRSVKVIPQSKGRQKKMAVNASSHAEKDTPPMELVDPLLAKQSFSSEQQALNFFTESIASKVAGDPAQRADLQQFLQLLLETDPLLREELVAELNINPASFIFEKNESE